MIILVDFLACEDFQCVSPFSQILSTGDMIIFVFLSLFLTVLSLVCENSQVFRLLCRGGILHTDKNRETTNKRGPESRLSDRFLNYQL